MTAFPYLINQATFADYEDLSVNIKSNRISVYVKKAQIMDLRVFMGQSFYTDFIQYFQNSGLGTIGISTATTTKANGTYLNQSITGGSGENGTVDVTVLNGNVTSITANQLGYGYADNDNFTVASIPGAAFIVSALSPNVVLSPNMPANYADLFNGLTYLDTSGNNVSYGGIVPALVYWTFARFVENDPIHFTSTGPVVKLHDDSTALSQKDIIKIVERYRSEANVYANDIEMYLWNNRATFSLWRFNEQNKSARQAGPRIRGVDKTAYNAPGIGGRYDNNYWGIDGYGY